MNTTTDLSVMDSESFHINNSLISGTMTNKSIVTMSISESDRLFRKIVNDMDIYVVPLIIGFGIIGKLYILCIQILTHIHTVGICICECVTDNNYETEWTEQEYNDNKC